MIGSTPREICDHCRSKRIETLDLRTLAVRLGCELKCKACGRYSPAPRALGGLEVNWGMTVT